MSQEKEYKEALEAFNEKNREKTQLVTKLMEVKLINQSSQSARFHWAVSNNLLFYLSFFSDVSWGKSTLAAGN